MRVSVVIPVYNEERAISTCLKSLAKQTRSCEIIVVDDGSTDNSKSKIQNAISQLTDKINLRLFEQKHKGPGAARNIGAKNAKGDIIVFVDADMTFEPKFIEVLVKPIEHGKSQGTFTKEEYVENWDNVWARCWNYNQGISDQRRIPENYPDKAPVFRAILKKEFERVGGFTEGVGWTDDWTLARKLGYKSTATLAVCYHSNPRTLTEVFQQARWIGKNEILTKNLLRIFINLIIHSFLVSLLVGIYNAIKYCTLHFLLFKVNYDWAITLSLVEGLSSTHKNK